MWKTRKIVATIEARMTSSRLPGKVLLPLAQKPALERMIERVIRSQYIDDIVIATTTNKSDDEIIKLCESINCKYFRGSEEDVLLRVLNSAKSVHADIIVELTGDCPLIDPNQMDEMIKFYFEKKVEYANNRLIEGLPDGFDIQVFSTNDLERVEKSTNDPIDRVHVSSYFYRTNHEFKIGYKELSKNDELYWPDLAVTLDEKEDYYLISNIFENLYYKNPNFSAVDIIRYLRKNKNIVKLNKGVRRKSLEEG
jgi:spore coat polysaccharide biosynthesis protein SpsF